MQAMVTVQTLPSSAPGKGECIHTYMLYQHVYVLRVTPEGAEDAGICRPLLERDLGVMCAERNRVENG